MLLLGESIPTTDRFLKLVVSRMRRRTGRNVVRVNDETTAGFEAAEKRGSAVCGSLM